MASESIHDTTSPEAPIDDEADFDFDTEAEGLAEWESKNDAAIEKLMAAKKAEEAREAERRLAAQQERQRLARLKAEEVQRERRRREHERLRAIQSLMPAPIVNSGVILDAKAIREAQAAYNEGCERLTEDWHARFRALPEHVLEAWALFHEYEFEWEREVALRERTPSPDEFPDDLSALKVTLADPEYVKFRNYSAAVLQQIEQLRANVDRLLSLSPGSRPPLKGWSLDEIDENDGAAWPVPGLMPHGLTFVYGLPKCGKSLWMQKLSACVAGGVPFDGIEGLVHGSVLYITRDIGASRQEVKKRFVNILSRINVPASALNGKLVLTDEPFFLNDPASVDNLLAHNPGPFVLVVIDSLFRCVNGSLSQDAIASAAVEGIDRISRATGAAVVAIHHEPRGGEHLFGSVMLDAAYDAKIHVERGGERNSVIVTVQELKNAAIPDRPFTYRIEEEYLAPISTGSALSATKPEPSRHQAILALLPAGWISRKEARKLVEPLLSGGTEARRKQWARAIAAMAKAGDITVKGRSIRKA